MLQLNPIQPQKILKIHNIMSLFPMVVEYLCSGKWGQTYFSDDYEWFYITDDSYESEEQRNTILSFVCLKENKFNENSLHLSVFEVAKPIRGLNIGTEVISRLIDIALENKYKSLTLQIREPELYRFYRRFGFRNANLMGKNYLELPL